MMDMSVNDVISRLKEIHSKGEPLNKKKIKKSDPELMKHTLYYYPSWEHALQENGLS